MELVVGMLIMTIFMGMFTSAVVMMNQATTKAESVNNTSSQLNQAFLALDKTVRYAAAISTPGKGSPSGDWFVELRSTNSGVEVCTQLRLRAAVTTQQLERRTWTVTGTTVSNLSSWKQLASSITNGGVASGTDQPFALNAQSDAVDFQQLTVQLVSTSGAGSTSTTSSSSVTFTAVNSRIPPPTGAICQEVARS